jgi:multiple sugar transport system permease protein
MTRPYLLVSPVQALIFLFLFIPALYVGWLSFNDSTFGRDNVFVGLANYQELFADPYFWRALWNTFLLVNIIVYVELALGLAIALLFASGVPFSKLLIALVFLPYATSEVVAIVMVKYMFDPQIGMATIGLQNLGLPPVDLVNPIHAFGVVVLISTWQHLPFSFILLYTARIGIPNDLYEAARLDGARPLRIFWHITLRLLMPAILISLLFRYIFAFRIFSEVWLLTQGGPARMTEVLAVYLYRVAFRYQEFGLASATGWVMVFLSVLISAFYLRAMYRRMFA